MKIKLKQMAGKLLFAIGALGLGLASCTYYTNDFDPIEVPDEVKFEEHIIPIFDASCNGTGCHNGTIPPDLTAPNAYNSLWGGGYIVPGESAETSGLYQSIDGGSMTGYATDQDRAIIKKWIDDGAENN